MSPNNTDDASPEERFDPLMTIHFPANKEAELLGSMTGRATPPWSRQPHNPFGKLPTDGQSFFHRDGVGTDLPCTLCIHRESPGRFVVGSIVPDATASVHQLL